MTMLLADDEGFILRRTFYLLRLGEWQGDHELVQVCVRHDWVKITKADADSAKRKDEGPGSEEEKQQRLNGAVASWMADELTHPILETHFWDSDVSFPIETAGDVVADVNQGLNDLFVQRAESIAEWAGGPIVIDGPVAGITTNLVLKPIAEPLTKISEIFWTVGLVVGFATGHIALSIGCAKALAKETIKEAVTKAIGSNLLDPARTVAAEGHDAATAKQRTACDTKAERLSSVTAAVKLDAVITGLTSFQTSNAPVSSAAEETGTPISAQAAKYETLLRPRTAKTRATDDGLSGLGPAR